MLTQNVCILFYFHVKQTLLTLQLSHTEFSSGSELRTLYVTYDSNLGIWRSLNLVVKGLTTFLLLPAVTYFHIIQTELRKKNAVFKD